MPFAGAASTVRAAVRRLGRPWTLLEPAELGALSASTDTLSRVSDSAPGKVYRVRAARTRPQADAPGLSSGARVGREAVTLRVEKAFVVDPDTGARVEPREGWSAIDQQEGTGADAKPWKVDRVFTSADGAAWTIECSRRLKGAR